jgi:hypothetical protein
MTPRYEESHSDDEVRVVVGLTAVAGEVAMVTEDGAGALPAVMLRIYADALGKDIPEMAKTPSEADEVFTFALSVGFAESIAAQLADAAQRAQS